MNPASPLAQDGDYLCPWCGCLLEVKRSPLNRDKFECAVHDEVPTGVTREQWRRGNLGFWGHRL